MLQIILTTIHILACIFLVLVVLLQTGKGAEMGAVFGGSSSTVFGSSGAGNFLTKMTTATAIIFMLTSLTLTWLSAKQTTATIFDSNPISEPAQVPAPKGGQPAPEAAPQAAEPQAAQPAPAAAPEGGQPAPAPAAAEAPIPVQPEAKAANEQPAPAGASQPESAPAQAPGM